MNDKVNDVDAVLDHTLDTYLLGLADGIRDAQNALNQIVVPSGALGQAAVAYHLPKLEFELRMHMSVRSGAGNSRQILFRPALTTGDLTSVDVVSTVSGSFVSVPLAGGKPQARLLTGMSVMGKGMVGLSVTVIDALGKPQRNVEVNFNLDRDKSIALTLAGRPAGGAYAPAAGTGVAQAVVLTDDNGHAANVLKLDLAEPADALIVVIVEIPGTSESLLVPAQTGLNDAADR